MQRYWASGEAASALGVTENDMAAAEDHPAQRATPSRLGAFA
ncbi:MULTISPECIES: hypothetical protein [unclassified Novosphingobium]|nr:MULTISPECIES: hypothetical protein [unclassified Novosphingobium]HQV04985.1 hypothetical protein [Novosphingobium sp.]